MTFHDWCPDTPTGHDAAGVPIPGGPAVAAPGIVLLPVVGVDRRGYRLGYGGGYFDRTLAALDAAGARPLCIGVGFLLSCVDTIRPQPHDQPLDMLVTENGLRHFLRSSPGG